MPWASLDRAQGGSGFGDGAEFQEKRFEPCIADPIGKGPALCRYLGSCGDGPVAHEFAIYPRVPWHFFKKMGKKIPSGDIGATPEMVHG